VTTSAPPAQRNRTIAPSIFDPTICEAVSGVDSRLTQGSPSRSEVIELAAVAAVSAVDEVAGRYRTVAVGPSHTARLLLAKNPAGWQEALSMLDRDAAGVVISVNGQVPDGEDLSWLWDVRFEHFENVPVVAAGERGTDLAVRLGYAGVEHTLVHDTMAAIRSCPPGHVEVLANYTAFLQLNRRLP